MDEKIDFIVARVDDNDKQWKILRDKYAGKSNEDSADYRFRDRGIMKYYFRGIEKFAPWVNNVFFVTCGHYPSWLNSNHPKLKFIKHEDYIPKEYLPTFNSHTIELNFNRINELSNCFVYFNDDMFIINHMKQSDFFENGVPKHIAWLEPIPTNNEKFWHIMLNNVQLINRHFPYMDLLKKNWRKWYYPGYGLRVLSKTLFLKNFPYLVWFNNPHLPSPLLKSTMDKLRNEEYEILDNSSKSKFRSKEDVNQYVFSWYDIASWNFIPRNSCVGRNFSIRNNNNKKLIKAITKQKYKMICINDNESNFDFEKIKLEVISAFEKILPEKSEYEI